MKSFFFKEIGWSDELQFDTGLPKSRSMHIRMESGMGAIMAMTPSKVTWKQGAIKQFNRKTTV